MERYNKLRNVSLIVVITGLGLLVFSIAQVSSPPARDALSVIADESSFQQKPTPKRQFALLRLAVPPSLALGVGLILMGLGCRAAMDYWLKTRIVNPVDMPVSLAVGHIRTQPFRLNLKADYWITLHPGTDWRWDAAHPQCDPYRRLQTRWTLYKSGEVVERSDEPTLLPWPSIFSAGPGVYELDVEVMDDFSCLDQIPPRLEVVANTDAYEAAASFARVALSLVTYIGVICLTFVPIVRCVHSFEHSETVSERPFIGQNFQWARRLPLRPQISGLPSFGLVGVMIYGLVAMVMMMLLGFGAPMSTGLRVRLLKQGVVPQKSDVLTEPLIVRVKASGLGKTPNLYVNSKLVAWEAFDQVLRQELSIRRERVVYIGGDGEMDWQNFVNLIDVAREDHATVYLIKETTKISK